MTTSGGICQRGEENVPSSHGKQVEGSGLQALSSRLCKHSSSQVVQMCALCTIPSKRQTRTDLVSFSQVLTIKQGNVAWLLGMCRAPASNPFCFRFLKMPAPEMCPHPAVPILPCIVYCIASRQFPHEAPDWVQSAVWP